MGGILLPICILIQSRLRGAESLHVKNTRDMFSNILPRGYTNSELELDVNGTLYSSYKPLFRLKGRQPPARNRCDDFRDECRTSKASHVFTFALIEMHPTHQAE